VKAAPEAQRRLLDLQSVDTALAQLAHKRKTLPELAEIETVAREISALQDERVRAQVAVDDLDRDISRFEKDIEQVRLRKDRDQQRLDAGGAVREIEGVMVLVSCM
jgi:predicted  nucleic acid-binding Zn-ribbon protein